MERPNHIHMVGAGLVGSLLAVMLGQRGYRVTLLERRADMRDREVDGGRSINLALSSRGIHALQQAGLMDDVESLLIPMNGRQLHFEDGRQEFMPYGQRPGEVIYSVSRRDLNRLMMSRAEEAELVEIEFQQQLESVDFEEGNIRLLDLATQGTRELPFELLIGADGAGSRTRRAMLPSNGATSSSEFLDHDYKELEIPPATGPGVGMPGFQIEPHALHIWPRGEYMLIALPNQDGSFTVTLFLPRQGPNSFEQLNQPEQVLPFFQAHFPDAVQLIPDLETDYRTHPQGRLGTLRCSKWYHGRQALILGDAAHAIVPFHGQGMNAGFEDASELIRLLDRFDDDWGRVLPEFDRLRRPNANAIADMALENYVTMRDSVIDPQFQLKKDVGFELERRFPDRFIPRYSMVMFHLIPYAVAWQRGELQRQLLDTLVGDKSAIEEIDWDVAESLVQARLTPLDRAGEDGKSGPID